MSIFLSWTSWLWPPRPPPVYMRPLLAGTPFPHLCGLDVVNGWPLTRYSAQHLVRCSHPQWHFLLDSVLVLYAHNCTIVYKMYMWDGVTVQCVCVWARAPPPPPTGIFLSTSLDTQDTKHRTESESSTALLVLVHYCNSRKIVPTNKQTINVYFFGESLWYGIVGFNVPLDTI